MNVLLHDLSLENANNYLSINDKSSLQIVCMSDKPPVKCVGCFGCWIKNPGECIMKDGYNHMGEYFGNCKKII